MLRLRIVVLTLSVGLMYLDAQLAFSQSFPTRPVRIVTGPAGGGIDVTARLIAQWLGGPLGQQVIVENRTSLFAAEIVGKAQPDGYTLLLAGSPMWIAPLLQKPPYDPVKDFSPISLAGRSLNVLVVHPSLPVNSVKELISLAKAKPGTLNYASSGTGGPGHLTGELFKSMAGVDIVRISFKGGAAAFSDLMAGQVQMTFDNPSTVMPLVKAGKLRVLAVTSAEQSALVPGLPTVAAALPGFKSVQMSGILAPAKTPEAIIKQLNQEIIRILNTPDVKETFFNRGIEVVHSSPKEFAATIKSEIVQWDKVIKDAGIKAD